MKIVHVTECLAGGVLTFLVNFTKQLQNDEHIIIYGRRKNTPENVESIFPRNVSCIYWENAQREIRPMQDLSALLELLKKLKTIDNIDILQLHSSKAGVLGRVASRILGLQKRTFYSPQGLSFARKDVSRNKRNIYIFLERVANCISGRVIAASKSEQCLLNTYGIKNSVLINNGVEVPNVEPAYKTRKEYITFGTIGRLTYQKNPKDFNTIAEHFRSNKNIRFLWIGDGELRKEIHENDNLQVTGWVKPDMLDSYLDKIDVYISTALWEGLSIALLDAMKRGKPLLLSDCIGNTDVVQEGVNGFLFHSVKECISKIEMISELPPDTLKELGRSSYKIVKTDFSLNQLGEKYRLLYQNACNS